MHGNATWHLKTHIKIKPPVCRRAEKKKHEDKIWCISFHVNQKFNQINCVWLTNCLRMRLTWIYVTISIFRYQLNSFRTVAYVLIAKTCKNVSNFLYCIASIYFCGVIWERTPQCKSFENCTTIWNDESWKKKTSIEIWISLITNQ